MATAQESRATAGIRRTATCALERVRSRRQARSAHVQRLRPRPCSLRCDDHDDDGSDEEWLRPAASAEAWTEPVERLGGSAPSRTWPLRAPRERRKASGGRVPKGSFRRSVSRSQRRRST